LYITNKFQLIRNIYLFCFHVTLITDHASVSLELKSFFSLGATKKLFSWVPGC